MGNKDKQKFYAAVYLVLIKNKKLLLSRRFQTGWQDGMYSLPAGHMDGNESVAEATAREAKEEIGITLNPKDLKVIQVIHRFSPSNKIPREYIDFFLTATIWQGEIKNCEPEKCDEVCWYLLNKLPKNILPYVKNTLKNFERGVFFSEEVF